jgi:hypothetical protein
MLACDAEEQITDTQNKVTELSFCSVTNDWQVRKPRFEISHPTEKQWFFHPDT